MSSGKQHDRHCLALSPIVGAVAAISAPILGLPQAIAPIVAAISFCIGGMLLSPDLDILSRPYKRWGVLRWYWWPYQKLMKHRGISHLPILGTMTRLGWLLWPVALFAPHWMAIALTPLGLMAIGCIELSAWVHLMGDAISTWIKRIQ